jgi:hypothetical protein
VSLLTPGKEEQVQECLVTYFREELFTFAPLLQVGMDGSGWGESLCLACFFGDRVLPEDVF